MTDKENQRNSQGKRATTGSFKDQILKALQDGDTSNLSGIHSTVSPSKSSSNTSSRPRTSRENNVSQSRQSASSTDKVRQPRSSSKSSSNPKRSAESKSDVKRNRRDEAMATTSKKRTPKSTVAQERLSENRQPSRAKRSTPQRNEKPSKATQRKVQPKKQQKNKAPLSDRDREDKIVGRIVKFVVGILLILLIVVGVTGVNWFNSSTKPLNPKDNSYVQVEVPIGSSNKQIGGILQKAKVIKNGTVFNYYTKFHNLANFQSGYYNLQPSMTLDEIAKILQKGGTPKPELPVLGKVTIPEGYTLEQISDAITVNVNTKKGEKTPFTKDEFLKLVKSDAFFAKMKEKYPDLLDSASKAKGVKFKLEGYLFPATYDYNKDTTMESLVETMIATMDQTLQAYYPQIKAKGMTVQEILALASYVEKEGAKQDDRRNIAQVFYNRMDAGMPLQSNISVLYAEGKLGEKISAQDDKNINTKIDSPYNLYVHTGVGPGPVDSPSLMSIEAALEPKANDYLYFIADTKTGKVYFAKTFEEHNALVAEHLG